MLIDVVADEHIHPHLSGNPAPHGGEHLLQGVGVHPVVRVHHLIIDTGGVAQSLVHALAVAAVGLVDHPDDVRMLLRVAVRDGAGLVRRAVVYQDDLHLVAAGEQGVNTVGHVRRRIVARDGKGKQLQSNRSSSVVIRFQSRNFT